MSSVITFKHTWIKEGKLFHSDLAQIWKDEAFRGLQDLLLKLLEDFGVAFHIRNHDPPYSLLPILMPDKRPSRTIAELWTPLPTPSQGSPTSHSQSYAPADISKYKSGLGRLGRTYKFQFLPEGLFGKLMVRLLHIDNVQGRALWKNGILLEIPSIEAVSLVQCIPAETKIIVEVGANLPPSSPLINSN